MPSGGSRKNASHKACEGKGCERCNGTGKAPVGNKKLMPEEPVGKMDKGFAARVMELIGTKDWTKLTLETVRNAEEYALTFLIAGDARAQGFFLRLLEWRYGKAPQPVFNADTRENAPGLDFGDLPMPASHQSGATGKPN